MPFNNNDQIGVTDPMLGPLQHNGGPTDTHLPLPGSPAIDAGDLLAMAGTGAVPSFDQRGSPFGRVVGNRIDVGSVESQSALPDCDFDDDGDCDGMDIDALVTEIAAGTHGVARDLTGDGLVDLADRDAWLARAGAIHLGTGNPYLLGDANLDGVVDGSDFNIWNSNKFTFAAQWTKGDFNADGSIDGSDFNIWNSNKFTSAASPASRIALPASHRADIDPDETDDHSATAAKRQTPRNAASLLDWTDHDDY